MKAPPPASENPYGFHQRYNITKQNGEPIDPKAVYFVLRLDPDGDDPAHLAACRHAAEAYSRGILTLPDARHLQRTALELIEYAKASAAETRRRAQLFPALTGAAAAALARIESDIESEYIKTEEGNELRAVLATACQVESNHGTGKNKPGVP